MMVTSRLEYRHQAGSRVRIETLERRQSRFCAA